MIQGLTHTEASLKLKQYGFNEIIETSKNSPLKILLRQAKGNVVLYMLFGAAFVSYFLDKEITTYTILIVILSVILVGFLQEYKAEEAVASLKKMIMPMSVVIREGKKIEISSRDLVPDDILVLGNGEKIPADSILIEAHDLKVNESILTGESKDISKSALLSSEKQPDENIISMGTYIVSGRCVAKITHTGMNTKFGKIAHLISSAEKELPLQQKVNDIAKYMVVIAIITSVATGLLMAYRAEKLDVATVTEILILIVALAVSAFPEGFPVVLITTLALGAKRMSEKNAIVNRMSIIETLGEVNIICSDKTGTLTKGEMTVKFIFTGSSMYEAEGSGYVGVGKINLEGEAVDASKKTDYKKLIEAVVLCNDAEIERTGENDEYHIRGTPTEAALLILAAKSGIYKENYDQPRLGEYPFNSDRKMMSVLYEKDGEYVVYAKGAPEVVLKKCKTLPAEEVKKIVDLQNEMANSAYRTLAVACKKLNSATNEFLEDDLTFLGLIAMEDSPREESAEAIRLAEKAGVRVIMCTGDSKETAVSIAKQIGLNTEVVEGSQLDQMSDQELSVVLKNTTIYARVRPDHKIRIVKTLKNVGFTVAMTGDGVNDAPALKEAHVGIAMGKNGTDVSRSVADLVLKDDNFATIVAAIAEGRTVFSNIRKFVTYQLSCSLAEILVLLIGVAFAPLLGWQTPILLSMQILFMNIVTDNLPALTLGLNPSSKDIMLDKPRNSVAILNPVLVTIIAVNAVVMCLSTLVAYYISFNYFSYSHETSRTVAMLTLILVEIFSAFSFRSFRQRTLNRSPFNNMYLVWASVISMLMTLIIMYTPAKAAFETTYVDFRLWIVALACSGIVLVLNDVIKIVNLKSTKYIVSTR